jgi:hypothetical protein
LPLELLAPPPPPPPPPLPLPPFPLEEPQAASMAEEAAIATAAVRRRLGPHLDANNDMVVAFLEMSS